MLILLVGHQNMAKMMTIAFSVVAMRALLVFQLTSNEILYFE